jgi:hypothetical protein
VFTRGADECPGNDEPIAELKATGCAVELRDQMHEKVVVIDDVLWHGSLNLFAQTRATELMMRIESAAACDNARRVVERAKPTRPRYGNISQSPGSQLIYLNVPFGEKDEAKALGARYNGARKEMVHRHPAGGSGGICPMAPPMNGETWRLIHKLRRRKGR